jgi:hypothetical protein
VVVPVSGVDVHPLADQFREKFKAQKVEPQTQADSAKEIAATGDTDPPTPCPASGEFPSH